VILEIDDIFEVRGKGTVLCGLAANCGNHPPDWYLGKTFNVRYRGRLLEHLYEVHKIEYSEGAMGMKGTYGFVVRKVEHK
jgi:hypothetical protein